MLQVPEPGDPSPAECAYRPPAPRPQPRPLGPIGLVRTLKRNPLECWAAPHFEQPVVAGGLPIGHVLLVHEPGAIRRVLLDNAANYRKDRLQRRVLSAGLNDGLLSAEGEQWRAATARDRPDVCAQDRDGFCAGDDGSRRGPDRSMVKILATAQPSTSPPRWRRSHSTSSSAPSFPTGFGHDAEDIRKAMATYFNTIGKISPLDILGVPDFVPRLSRLRVHSTLKFFEAEVDRVISTRRRILAEQPDCAPNDLLTHLLEARDATSGNTISEAEVRSNILTFIAAGHETTANTLSWALFLLSQSREWRERVAAEADRELTGPIAGIADRLVETRAVIEETVRLYPPIAAISRVALGPDELNGEPVRPGSLIVISPYVLHRHRLLWDRPDAFDPRRFLGHAQATIDRFAYLPFGAGPRKCIGSTFALQEATLVLASLVKHFHFQLRPGHAVWPMLRVTLRPANGLPMIIGQRSSSERSSRGRHQAGASQHDEFIAPARRRTIVPPAADQPDGPRAASA